MTKKEKIICLLELYNFQGNAEQMTIHFLNNSKLKERLPNFEEMKEDLVAGLRVIFEEQFNKQVVAYDRNYTEEEIDALIAFNSSDVGRAICKKVIQLNKDLSDIDDESRGRMRKLIESKRPSPPPFGGFVPGILSALLGSFPPELLGENPPSKPEEKEKNEADDFKKRHGLD